MVHIDNPPLILKLIFPVVMLFLGIMFTFATNVVLDLFYKLSSLMNNPFADLKKRKMLFGIYKVAGVIFLVAGIICLIGVFFWGFFS